MEEKTLTLSLKEMCAILSALDCQFQLTSGHKGKRIQSFVKQEVRQNEREELWKLRENIKKSLGHHG